nr:ABC transporter permease [Acidobacteriota bacterium]
AMKPVRKIAVPLGQYLPEGDLDRGARVAVLGAKIRDELFPGQNPLGAAIRLGDERFRVIGVMGQRGTSLGENLDEVIHVPVAHGLKLANRRGLFRLLIEVTSHEDTEAAKQQVLAVLKERHGGVEDVTVLTQDAVLSTFNRILAILTAALAGIAAISLSVAGIGIMNVMLVSVSERTREIGLLKALGVTPRQVVGVFLTEAAILSTLGGLVGVILGFAMGRAVRLVYPAFPVAAPGWAVAAAIGVSVAVGLVFGVLPARRAARLDPVAALAGR